MKQQISSTGVIYLSENADVMQNETAVLALVGIKDGIFSIDFGRQKINFMPRADFRNAMEFLSDFISMKNVYHTPEFMVPQCLQFKNGTKGIRYYPCGSITIFDTLKTAKDKKIVIEYIDIDTNKAKLESLEGSYDDDCMVVYLPVDEKDLTEENFQRCKIFDFGEEHKPLWEKSVMVKLYP